jgi:hypothetical protein
VAILSKLGFSLILGLLLAFPFNLLCFCLSC